MFRKREPFHLKRVFAVPRGAGVYIIYQDGRPFYVGRSRRDIRERLLKHVSGTGSVKIKRALDHGMQLEFEYQEMISVEQVEAVLIIELGTLAFGNLRRETDPADWL